MIKFVVFCDGYNKDGRGKCKNSVSECSLAWLEKEMRGWCWFTNGEEHYCSFHADEARKKAEKK